MAMSTQPGLPVLELNWGTVRNCAFPELFDVAGRTGFDRVTVTRALYQAARNSGATDAELVARMRDSGARIGYLDGGIRGLPGVPAEPGAFERSQDEVFRFAGTFGARVLNVHHYGGTAVPFAELADAIGAVAERAAAEGVAVVLEFIPGTGIPDLASAIRLVEALGVGEVSILLDTWHHWRSGGRMTDLAALGPGMIGAVQLSDMPAERIGTWLADDSEAAERNARLYVPMSGRLLPGDGALPLHDVVSWLRRTCPAVGLGVETFSTDLDALAADDVATAAAASLRRLLPRDPSAGC